MGDDAYTKVHHALSIAEESLQDLQSEPVASQLEKLLQTIEEALSDSEDKSVLVSCIKGQTLYLMRSQSSVLAYLWRKNRHTDLSNLAPESKLVSGMLQEGDRVVFTTTSLLAVLANQREKLFSLPLDSIEDEIDARLTEVHVDPVAAVVLDFGENHYAKAEEVIPESPVEEDPKVRSWRQVHFHLPTRAQLHRLIPRTKQQYMYATLIVVGTVGLVVGSFILYRKSVTQNQQFQAYYQKALTEYNQAQALKDSDGPNAKQSLFAAKADIAAALKVNPKQKEGLALQQQITDNTPVILKLVQVKDFPLWLDLGLVKKNFTTQNLSLSVGNLLVLDTTQKSLVAIDMTKKSNQILTGGDKLGDAQFASLNGDSAFAYSSDKGILKIDLPNGGTLKDPTVVVKKDDKWGHVSDLYAFAGNLYVVDEFKNAVFKYVPTASGYSDAQNYFADNVKVDLAGTRKMQIDGSVWILKNDGELFKFTQGYRDYFSYDGLDQPVSNPKSFFVSSDTQNLYLLDSGNNRLLVLDKKGNYVNQYVADQFAQFSDLMVDEANHKAYLLGGSKIFQIALWAWSEV